MQRLFRMLGMQIRFGLSEPEFEPHFLTLERLKTWMANGVPNDTLAIWEETAKEHKVFHWFDAFPEVAKRGGLISF